jgi:hypothetical protein
VVESERQGKERRKVALSTLRKFSLFLREKPRAFEIC